MFSILFVCTGNTCRSPMAEGLMRAMLPDGAQGRVVLRSAGLMAAAGLPATTNSVKVMAGRDIRLGEHRSVRVTREMIAEADLILAMEEEHRRQIVALVPGAADRTFVLSDFESDAPRSERLPIHDPIGGSVETYEETCRRIEEHLHRVLPVILDRVGAD